MMTQIERGIYDSVLGAVRQGWNAVEQLIASELVVAVTPVTPATPVASATSAAQVRHVESAPPVPEAATARPAEDAGGLDGVEAVNLGAPEGYTIVRVLKNIPTFVGTDSHHYTLAKNDVVTLPDLHAKVLCKRRAVLPVAISSGSG
jgi:DNA replication initiation complex subunit (GINS family)